MSGYQGAFRSTPPDARPFSGGHPAMISSLGSYGSSGTTSMLQKFFSKADANSDSSLSKDELVSALSKSDKTTSASGGKLSSAVDDLVSSLDSDSNGSLSSTEFSSFASQFDYSNSSTLLAAQEASSQQRFQSFYSSLDSDSSGGVSQDELSSAVSSYLSSSGQSSTDSSAL
jgi:Ca2+-binding EF-hand superfamily protein